MFFGRKNLTNGQKSYPNGQKMSVGPLFLSVRPILGRCPVFGLAARVGPKAALFRYRYILKPPDRSQARA